jgi:hypothetical protein
MTFMFSVPVDALSASVAAPVDGVRLPFVVQVGGGTRPANDVALLTCTTRCVSQLMNELPKRPAVHARRLRFARSDFAGGLRDAVLEGMEREELRADGHDREHE